MVTGPTGARRAAMAADAASRSRSLLRKTTSFDTVRFAVQQLRHEGEAPHQGAIVELLDGNGQEPAHANVHRVQAPVHGAREQGELIAGFHPQGAGEAQCP